MQDMQILNKKTWPSEVNICFGENEIKRLSRRFLLNQEKSIKGIKILVDDENSEVSKIE